MTVVHTTTRDIHLPDPIDTHYRQGNTMSELEQIRGRLNAASKGPWQAGVAATSDGSEVCTTYEQKKAFLALSLNDGDRPLWIVDNGEVIPAATGDGPNAGHNAEFIAHAPTDMEFLLDLLKPRQVSTVRELHTLASDSVIRTVFGAVFVKDGGWWAETGTRDKSLSADLDLPATVLYSPVVAG